MPRIRVLVVDDSAVVRRLVSEALALDKSIEVVGTAPNGQVALAKLSQLSPDVVTLDIEMPVLDGLATLVELRKSYPKLPVIMFSSLTERGAAATLDAIARGATDYVTKPPNSDGPDEARRRIAAELVPRIKAFAPVAIPAGQTALPQTRSAAQGSAHTPAPRPQASSRIDVVAIGVSTGGPTALAEVLPKLPRDFPVPVLVVQHMPPLFTKMLADRLATHSALAISECQGDELLQKGHVYIAKGDYHMLVRGPRTEARLGLNQAPQENSCRPAVDVLFRSAAQVFGPNVLAVVLTGMGQDGLRGCEHIREAGGVVFAQDQASSLIWGMPGAVAKAGFADKLLPLNRMVAELVARVGSSPRTVGLSL